MPLKYHNFLFDLDGTIIDSSQDIAVSLREAFLKVLGRGSVTVDKGCVGLQLNDMLFRVDPALTASQINELVSVYRTIYDGSGFTRTCLYAGAKEALLEIRKGGAALFLVTNKPVKPTLAILNKLELNIFKEVVCPDCAGGRKMSKSEMVFYLIDKWALDKRKTIMIGDAEPDICAAKNNAIHSAAILSGYGDQERIRALTPEYFFEDISSLSSILVC